MADHELFVRVRNSMKKIIIFISGLIIGISTTSLLFYFTLYDSHSIEEIKICTANLDFATEYNMHPQLREYLKERLYWNASMHMRYRADFFSQSMKLDYGPVDTSVLGFITGIKDSASPDEVYNDALKKFKK